MGSIQVLQAVRLTAAQTGLGAAKRLNQLVSPQDQRLSHGVSDIVLEWTFMVDS